MIDPRAIVHPGARIGRDVHIGPWTTVGADVEIGDGCRIASHVVLEGPTQLGVDNRIHSFASIGVGTPARAYKGEPTRLEIGDRNVIREGVTMHRGTVQDRGTTSVGNDNLFMPYAHVGHDCVVGSHIVMANNASVSGHVVVGDYATFGGYAGVPQFRSIGAHAMIGGMSLVLKDVPDFVLVSGNPARAAGLNLEGMRRRGIAPEVVAELRKAYRAVYRRGVTVVEALAALEPRAALVPELASFIASIRASKYGIVRPRTSARSE